MQNYCSSAQNFNYVRMIGVAGLYMGHNGPSAIWYNSESKNSMVPEGGQSFMTHMMMCSMLVSFEHQFGVNDPNFA